LIIVESEESDLVNLSAFVEAEGFIVHPTVTGEDAMHILSDGKIDAGIIDLQVPIIDENALILTAHILQPDMKFILCTDSMNYVLPRELLDIGISPQQVLVKPLSETSVLVRATKDFTEKERFNSSD
jgi:DNA-binding NtrC family response regulator